MGIAPPEDVDRSDETVWRESDEFARRAEQPSPGLAREFWWFIREYEAWWLVPLLIGLAVLGAAVWVGSSAAAPFIYPLI